MEFLDDTASGYTPPSPPTQIIPGRAAGEMGVDELKRLLYPLSTLGAHVVVTGGALPDWMKGWIEERRESYLAHPFATYTSLNRRAQEVISEVRKAGVCCSQVSSGCSKVCEICRLERKMGILRRGIMECRVRCERSEGGLVVDLEYVEEFLSEGKVLDLAENAGGDV